MRPEKEVIIRKFDGDEIGDGGNGEGGSSSGTS